MVKPLRTLSVLLWLYTNLSKSYAQKSLYDKHASYHKEYPFNPVMWRALDCEPDKFRVSIQFKYPFYGVIYTESSYPRCVYVEGRSNPQRQYNFTVPSEGCGSERIVSNGASEIRNTLLVQRDPLLIDRMDNSFQLICQTRQSDSSGAEFQTVALDKLQVLGPVEETVKKVVETGQNSKVQFAGKVLIGNGLEGPEVNGVVQLGERLTYVFECNTRGSPQEDCAISECWARGTGLNHSSVQLSDANGCSKHPSFWSDFEMQRIGTYHRIFTSSIWAWSFPSSEHVLISCKIRICLRECAVEPCSSVRDPIYEPIQPTDIPQLDGNSQYEALTGFSVVRKDRKLKEAADKSAEEQELSDSDEAEFLPPCVNSPAFATLISILLTTLVVMTLAVCLLLWKLHRIARQADNGDLLYSGSTASASERSSAYSSP